MDNSKEFMPLGDFQTRLIDQISTVIYNLLNRFNRNLSPHAIYVINGITHSKYLSYTMHFRFLSRNEASTENDVFYWKWNSLQRFAPEAKRFFIVQEPYGSEMVKSSIASRKHTRCEYSIKVSIECNHGGHNYSNCQCW